MPSRSLAAQAGARLAHLPDAGVCWDRLLFSAKESVYKGWFPLTGRWLDFPEADVRVEPPEQSINADLVHGAFEARLLVAGPVVNGSCLEVFAGRWLATQNLLLTAIIVPRTHFKSGTT